MATATRSRTARTRARIMAAAASAVTDKGIRATTVQDVLNVANVSRRTYYQYFRSLDDVLDALYQEAMDDLVEGMARAITSAEAPRDQITRAIDAYLEVQAAGGLLIIALQAEAIRPDSVLAHRRQTTLEALVLLLDEAMVQAVGAKIDRYVYRAMLIGIEGLVIHSQRHGPSTPEEHQRIAVVIKSIVLTVLLNAARLPSRDGPD